MPLYTSTVLDPTFPSRTAHWLCLYGVVWKATILSWYTVEYPFCHLTFLGTHTRLNVPVDTEKTHVTRGIFHGTALQRRCITRYQAKQRWKCIFYSTDCLYILRVFLHVFQPSARSACESELQIFKRSTARTNSKFEWFRRSFPGSYYNSKRTAFL